MSACAATACSTNWSLRVGPAVRSSASRERVKGSAGSCRTSTRRRWPTRSVVEATSGCGGRVPHRPWRPAGGVEPQAPLAGAASAVGTSSSGLRRTPKTLSLPSGATHTQHTPPYIDRTTIVPVRAVWTPFRAIRNQGTDGNSGSPRHTSPCPLPVQNTATSATVRTSGAGGSPATSQRP
jgi:hypothetical protein